MSIFVPGPLIDIEDEVVNGIAELSTLMVLTF